MTKSVLHGLIDNIDEHEMDIVFRLLCKFIPEVEPMPDEIDAIKQSQLDYENGDVRSHEEVWD